MMEEQRKWHIGKEIPVATILILVVQTIGAIWWAATISAKVEANDKATIVATLVQAQTDRRQDDEAVRSETRIITQLEKLSTKIDRYMEAKR